MIYLSTLLNCAIKGSGGRIVAHLHDVVVDPKDVFPRVKAVSLVLPRQPAKTHQGHADNLLIPVETLTSLDGPEVGMRDGDVAEVTPYVLQPGDVLLGRDILDKQIVDTQGRRIVKVNDLKLATIEGIIRLVGIDISMRGFLRRLGAERSIDLLERVLPIRLPERLITWNYVELEATERNAVRLNVAQAQLADLHPADIADIIEAMVPSEGSAVWQQMDEDTAADTLEEVRPSIQRLLLEGGDPHRISRILAKMDPDDAADVLGGMDAEHAAELIGLMDPAQAAKVHELLQYDRHTAGGIMTTEVFSIPEHFTADQAIAHLRTAAPADSTYYLFAVDEARRLVGVVSLRDLVTAPAEQLIAAIVNRDTIRVRLDDDQEEVARLIAHYDLLAVPVVDEHEVLKGMVTVDDVIDVIHEEATEDIGELTGATSNADDNVWRSAWNRLTWFGLSIVGGFVAAWLVRGYAPQLESSPAVVFFIPLLLSLASGSAAQSLSTMAGALGAGISDLREAVWREVRIGALVGVAAAIPTLLLAAALGGASMLSVAVGLGIALTLFGGAVAGALLPLIIRRLRLNPLAVSSPALYPIVTVGSIIVYLRLTLALLNSSQ